MAEEDTPMSSSQKDPEALARALSKRELPKRFYKVATHAPVEGGYAIHLDGRAVKTPGKAGLLLPAEDIARAVAAEWEAQEKEIDPAKMPLTRIANSAIDAVAPRFAEVADDASKYCGTDLLCYRADTPQALVERQMAVWDPILSWAEERLGGKFVLVAGLIHREQPSELIAAYRAGLDGLSPLKLAALHTAVTLSGSALLALALAEGRMSVDEAWAAAHVDEDYNIQLWGEDAQAAQIRAHKQKDFAAAGLILADGTA